MTGTQEVNKLLTQEEKRVAKITELDKARDDFLSAYNARCDELGVNPDFIFLMENGFGLSAGDCYDDEDLDAIIVEDERKAKEAQ